MTDRLSRRTWLKRAALGIGGLALGAGGYAAYEFESETPPQAAQWNEEARRKHQEDLDAIVQNSEHPLHEPHIILTSKEVAIQTREQLSFRGNLPSDHQAYLDNLVIRLGQNTGRRRLHRFLYGAPPPNFSVTSMGQAQVSFSQDAIRAAYAGVEAEGLPNSYPIDLYYLRMDLSQNPNERWDPRMQIVVVPGMGDNLANGYRILTEAIAQARDELVSQNKRAMLECFLVIPPISTTDTPPAHSSIMPLNSILATQLANSFTYDARLWITHSAGCTFVPQSAGSPLSFVPIAGYPVFPGRPEMFLDQNKQLADPMLRYWGALFNDPHDALEHDLTLWRLPFSAASTNVQMYPVVAQDEDPFRTQAIGQSFNRATVVNGDHNTAWVAALQGPVRTLLNQQIQQFKQ